MECVEIHSPNERGRWPVHLSKAMFPYSGLARFGFFCASVSELAKGVGLKIRSRRSPQVRILPLAFSPIFLFFLPPVALHLYRSLIPVFFRFKNVQTLRIEYLTIGEQRSGFHSFLAYFTI